MSTMSLTRIRLTSTMRRAIPTAARSAGSCRSVSVPNSEGSGVLPLIERLRSLLLGVLAAAGLAAVPLHAAEQAPAELRTEYAAAPLGLDTAAPRLAWRSPVAR